MATIDTTPTTDQRCPACDEMPWNCTCEPEQAPCLRCEGTGHDPLPQRVSNTDCIWCAGSGVDLWTPELRQWSAMVGMTVTVRRRPNFSAGPATPTTGVLMSVTPISVVVATRSASPTWWRHIDASRVVSLDLA